MDYYKNFITFLKYYKTIKKKLRDNFVKIHLQPKIHIQDEKSIFSNVGNWPCSRIIFMQRQQ